MKQNVNNDVSKDSPITFTLHYFFAFFLYITYIVKGYSSPTINAPGSIVFIGLSDNILRKLRERNTGS